ncbi:MAG: DUF4402 domain-containing protein [Alphaproteobacteria bacterium]|nr:DUF4402 domain-containing protein [Alphaproteobacteria bacterium]
MRLHVLTETKSFRCGLSLVSAAVFVLLAFPQSVSAGSSDSASATARVVSSLELSRLNDLRFGTIAPTGTAGTVTIDPDPFATELRTSDKVALIGNGFGAASFQVIGEVGLFYDVELPNAIDINSGDDSMDVKIFSAFPDGTKLIDVTGTGVGFSSFNVGATLYVGASQPSGTYKDSFNVSVTYQ